MTPCPQCGKQTRLLRTERGLVAFDAEPTDHGDITMLTPDLGRARFTLHSPRCEPT